MAYTVKKLSELSGVTVRTLHFYEEIGLLKPAYHGSNGYRYYEEKELLQLVPSSYLPRAHHWFILHGRYTCKAQKPLCGSCALQDICVSVSRA